MTLSPISHAHVWVHAEPQALCPLAAIENWQRAPCEPYLLPPIGWRIGLNVLSLSLDPGKNQIPEGTFINHLLCVGASNTGSIVLPTGKSSSSGLKHICFLILPVHSEQMPVVVVTETRASNSSWVPEMLLHWKKSEVELKCGLTTKYHFHLYM